MDALGGKHAMQMLDKEVPDKASTTANGVAVPLREFNLLRWFSVLPFVLALSNVFGVQTMLPLGMNKEFSLILMLSGMVNVLMVIPLCILFGAAGVVASIVCVEVGVTVCMGWLLASRGVHLFRMR